MKIIFATHHFPPRYHAGAEQYAYRISKELTKRGHSVEVITIESISKGGIEPEVEQDCFDGINVARLSFDLSKYEDPFTANFRNESLGKWFYEHLQKNRPDIVHVNAGYLLSCKVLEVSHQLEIPTFLTLHDYWFMCPRITLLRTNGDICQEPVSESRCTWCQLSNQRRYRLWDQMTKNMAGEILTSLGSRHYFSDLLGFTTLNHKYTERRNYIKEVLREVDAVISPSKFVLEKVEQYGLEAKSKIYMPFGYGEHSYIEEARNNNQTGKLNFGYLGQIAPHKGVHTLIKAFKGSKLLREQAELSVYGNMNVLKGYGKSLGELANGEKEIVFAGSYARDGIDEIMDKIDVLVVPSEWFENRPTVIIEAFYYKKPVIAADIGGIPELIEHGRNGLLFRAGDQKELTDQLERIVKDPAYLNVLRSGIEAVRTIGSEIDELENLYRSKITS